MGTRPAAHRFLDSAAPLAFAHRGGNEVAPENSLAAFASAVAIGFTYLETDVHLSIDGVVVAAHDERLDRTADCSGAIAEMTWSEISNVRLAGTEPIPTLEELLETFPDSRFNIDLKSDAVVDPALDLLDRCGAWDRVCIGAFSDHRLHRVRSARRVVACTSAGPREVAALVASSRLPRMRAAGSRRSATDRAAFSCVQVPVRHRGMEIMTRRFVDLVHRRGCQVHVWTIDDPAEMDRLLDLGADGIMTDRPSVLRATLEQRGQW